MTKKCSGKPKTGREGLEPALPATQEHKVFLSSQPATKPINKWEKHRLNSCYVGHLPMGQAVVMPTHKLAEPPGDTASTAAVCPATAQSVQTYTVPKDVLCSPRALWVLE